MGARGKTGRVVCRDETPGTFRWPSQRPPAGGWTGGGTPPSRGPRQRPEQEARYYRALLALRRNAQADEEQNGSDGSDHAGSAAPVGFGRVAGQSASSGEL